MIDTHTHLYLPEFNADGGGEAAVRRAVNIGVNKMILPNVDLSTVDPMLSLASKFPDTLYCALGLHPTEINTDWNNDLEKVFEYFESIKFVAIGEIGMDLYWDTTYRDEQMKAFDAQCSRAVELGLPVIIHCREGLDETLEVIKSYPDLQAVFHSFGGTSEDVERIRKTGDFYFGINGIVTFKNSGLRDVLPSIGVDRILLETDSPYLAPVPNRGKRNESAYLVHICAHIAQHLGKTTTEVAEATSANAENLFRI